MIKKNKSIQFKLDMLGFNDIIIMFLYLSYLEKWLKIKWYYWENVFSFDKYYVCLKLM